MIFIFQGAECCSDAPIAFHYISPEDMYLLEYILYRVKGHLVNEGIITPSKTLQFIEDIE